MWGRKGRRIADLEARDEQRLDALHRARRDAEGWEWRARTDAATHREREGAHRQKRDDYQRLAARAALIAAERDAATEGIAIEHARIEWLTDQLVTALGYPEAALGAPAPAGA